MTARNCCLSIFPMVGSLAAIALALVVFLGSYKNASGLKNVYFLRIDLTHLSASAVSGVPASAVSTINSQIPNLTQELGISNFYDAGVNGYCQGTDTSNGQQVDECFTPNEPYWFDLVTILQNATKTDISIVIPKTIKDYETILHAASIAMWVCYVVGIVFAALSVVAGLFSIGSRVAMCCASIISGITFILLLLASGLATGIFLTYHKYFNQEFDTFGVSANIDPKTFALTWVATACSLWAAFWWAFAMCCGSSRRSTRYVEEKQPFIGYVPHEQRF